MPTVIHAILGGAIGVFLHAITRQSRRAFNERSVIFFALNCLIGPDIIKIPRIFIDPGNPTLLALDLYLHSVFGWATWALGISLVFWWLGNVKASYPDSLTYLNVVKVVLAAGLTHLGLDVLDLSQEGYGSLSVLPWDGSTRFNLGTFHTGWGYYDGVLDIGSTRAGAALLFGIGLAFLAVLSRYLLRKDLRRAIVGATVFVAAINVLILLFGSKVVAGENDLGYFVYLSVFLVLPLGLLYWSFQDKTATLDTRRLLAGL